MRVEPLTASIGAELVGVNLAACRARRRPFQRDPFAAAQAQGAVPARPGHQPGRPRGLRPALRRARGPPGGRQPPGAPGPGADLQERPTSRSTATRTPGTPTPPGARAPPLGCVLRCVECPPVGGDTIWANMVLAYERLPRARQERDRRPARAPQHRGHFGAAMPIEKRLALKAQYPDAGAPGGARRIRKPARRFCSSTPSPLTSPTSTRRSTCASARTTTPVRPISCAT